MILDWLSDVSIDGRWDRWSAWKAQLVQRVLISRFPEQHGDLTFLFDAVPHLRGLTVQDPDHDLRRLEGSHLQVLNLLGSRPSHPLDGSALLELADLVLTSGRNLRGLLRAPNVHKLELHGWSVDIRLPPQLREMCFVGAPYLPEDEALTRLETLEIHGGKVVDVPTIQERGPALKRLDLFHVQQITGTNALGAFDTLERLTLWEPGAVGPLEGLRTVRAREVFLSGALFSKGPGLALRKELTRR